MGSRERCTAINAERRANEISPISRKTESTRVGFFAAAIGGDEERREGREDENKKDGCGTGLVEL